MIDSIDLPPIPRPVRVSANWRRSTILWAILSVFLGLVAELWIIKVVREEFSLAAHLKKVEGTVGDRQENSGKTSSYSLTIDYSLNGASYNKRFNVDEDLYAGSSEGQTVAVYVDQTDPTNASLNPVTREDAVNAEHNYAFAYLGGVVVVCLGFYAAKAEADKQYKRLEQWPLSMLSVTKVHNIDNRGGGLKVTGTIPDGKGRSLEVVDLSVENDVHVDRPIPVLVDPYSSTVVALNSIKAAEIVR